VRQPEVDVGAEGVVQRHAAKPVGDECIDDTSRERARTGQHRRDEGELA
jgi:hypothetical protein